MSKTPAQLSAQGSKDSPKKGVDPEFDSIKNLMRLLDRAFRNSKIHGITSATSQRFIDQFHLELTSHLTLFGSLSFVVQGFRLISKGEIVYENASPTENLAFTLFSDGIRELSLNTGFSKEDFIFLLETLGAEYDASMSDDDIISCLWKKNLSTISLVTAEEIMKSIDSAAVINPQESDCMTNKVSQVAAIHKGEARRGGQQKGRETTAGAGERGRGGFPLAEFEVSPQELETLAREIEEESSRNSSTLVMDMLTAILVSEQSPAILLKAVDVFGDILGQLMRRGEWKTLNKTLSLMEEVGRRPGITHRYREKLAQLFEQMAEPARLEIIAEGLNLSPRTNIDGLLTFLLRLTPSAVEALCALMSLLKHPGHRAVVSEAIVVLGKDNPDPLVQRLSHPTGDFVYEVIEILTRMAGSREQQMEQHKELFSNVSISLNERLAAALQPVANHKDTRVKREAINAFCTLTPNGNGVPLVAFVQDPSEAVGLAAIKHLSQGGYTVPLAVWMPVVSGKVFLSWPTAKKRAMFQAMSRTAGSESVPYWRELLTRWSWFSHGQVQELAVLAAETLGMVGTPEALSALEIGLKRRDSVVRSACETALEKKSVHKSS